MATVSRLVDASPDQVFAILSDGWTYSNWVVGTSHVRAVDMQWPQPGASLHHATGIWPLVIRDRTVAEAVEPGRSLTLTAQARPLGRARVVFHLTPEEARTRISMEETPISGPGRWLNSPPMEWLTARRNIEALARLAAIVERRGTPAAG